MTEPYIIPQPAAERVLALAQARAAADERLRDAIDLLRAVLGAPAEYTVHVDRETGVMAFVESGHGGAQGAVA